METTVSIPQALIHLPEVISPFDAKPAGKANQSPIDLLEQRVAIYRLQEAALFLLAWRREHGKHTCRFSIENEVGMPGPISIKGLDRESLVPAEFVDQDEMDEFACQMNEDIHALAEILDEKEWGEMAAFNDLLNTLRKIGWDAELMPGVIARTLDRFNANGSLLIASIQSQALSEDTVHPSNPAPSSRRNSL